MNSTTLPRMRTIQQAATMLKELDPGTCITPYRLRCWVLDGTLPHVSAGTKRLVNVDAILERLANGDLSPIGPTPISGVIRRIS